MILRISSVRTCVLLALGFLCIWTTNVQADSPPTLTNFNYVNYQGNYYTFVGQVTDENPAGCMIGFAGILQGISVDVDSDGSFQFTIELEPSELGTVDATAYDAGNLYSNVRSVDVLP